MQKVLVVAGGPLDLEQLRRELTDYLGQVIAVDGGGTWLAALGRQPDVLIGDFDSLGEAAVAEFSRAGVEVLRFPAEKDQTDLELALDWLIGRGVSEAKIIGGLGGRFDHTMANVGLLVHALNSGLIVWLVDGTHEMCVIRQRITLIAKPGWAVSLIPLPVATGVVTLGLQYPLLKEDLYFEHSRGLHNRFIMDRAEVDLDGGMLLVICFMED